MESVICSSRCGRTFWQDRIRLTTLLWTPMVRCESSTSRRLDMIGSPGSRLIGFLQGHRRERLDRSPGAKHVGRRLAGAGGVFAALMLVAGMLQVATPPPAAAAVSPRTYIVNSAAPGAGTLNACAVPARSEERR